MSADAPGPLVHSELCFGCGRTNLFGLQLVLDRVGPRAVTGRCFIKQDHQGPDRLHAHDGVIAAALSEAMALACGSTARPRTFESRIVGTAPVGAFLHLEAKVEEGDARALRATAKASAEGRLVAEATGSYRP